MVLLGMGWWMWQSEKQVVFEDLDVSQMQQRLVEERDLAIEMAALNGDYKCCIEPPCTMCFMEANKWNNFTPGTCACDDLIAEGKEPCPQCEHGLCSTKSDVEGDAGVCEIDSSSVEKEEE